MHFNKKDCLFRQSFLFRHRENHKAHFKASKRLLKKKPLKVTCKTK